jgi:hypothetical protein
MKRLLSAFIVLAVAAAFTAPAYAGILDAKTKADCEKQAASGLQRTTSAALKNSRKIREAARRWAASW